MHKLLSPPPDFSVTSTQRTSCSSTTSDCTTDGIAPQMTPGVEGKIAPLIDLNRDCLEASLLESSPQDHASLVLDLLTASIDSPRLWRGRDLSKPTHFILEDVLNLNEDQVERLIHFVIREGRPEKRVDLLLRSCFFKPSHIQVVFRKLAGMRQSLHLKEGQEEQRMIMIDKNKESTCPEGASPTTTQTTTAKERNDSNHTTTHLIIPSSMRSLLSRLPASSFDLNLCRQELTTFLRSLSPSNDDSLFFNTSISSSVSS